MKIEAICTNDGCPTVRENAVRSVQLLSCEKLSLARIPMDEYGNAVECPYCGSPVLIERNSRDEAQFPLGAVFVSGGARFVLAFGNLDQTVLAWAEPAAMLIARHVRGDFGSVTPEIREANLRAIEEGPLDPYATITSRYDFNNELLWVRTGPPPRHLEQMRAGPAPKHMTHILLPSEYEG